MPRYTWTCPSCKYEADHIVTYDERGKPIICDTCGVETVRQFPVEAVRGISTFEAYHDESLGCDIHDASEKRAVMAALDVHESGDPIRGGRNFEAKAPHLVGKGRLTGELFQDRRHIKKEDPMVAIERKDGTVDNVKFSELKSV